MFEELRIRRFRLFDEFRIESLGRINVLTGRNNSGKTTLLEAILQLCGGGHQGAVLTSNQMRELIQPGASPSDWATTRFGHIFHKLDTSTTICVEGQHSEQGKLSLEISFASDGRIKIPLGNGQDAAPIEGPDATLRYVFRQSGRQAVETTLRCTADGFDASEQQGLPPFPVSILTMRNGNVREDADRFSALRRRKEHDVVRDALQKIEPRLTNLEINSGRGEPMIFGDIGLAELVPLNVMGEGMVRVARLVLSIATSPKGVVLVDEIENGIHHSAMAKVWKAVHEAVTRSGVQIFAATHSFECVQAAAATIGDELRLYRLQPDVASQPIVDYPTEALEGALANGIEVR